MNEHEERPGLLKPMPEDGYDIGSPEADALIARHKKKWLYIERHIFAIEGRQGFTKVIIRQRWQFTYWPGQFTIRLPRWRSFKRVDP